MKLISILKVTLLIILLNNCLFSQEIKFECEVIDFNLPLKVGYDCKVSPVNPDHIYMVFPCFLYYTYDGGLHWERTYSWELGFGSGARNLSISPKNEDHLIYVYPPIFEPIFVTYYTTNKGKEWKDLNNFLGVSSCSAFWGPDSSIYIRVLDIDYHPKFLKLLPPYTYEDIQPLIDSEGLFFYKAPDSLIWFLERVNENDNFIKYNPFVDKFETLDFKCSSSGFYLDKGEIFIICNRKKLYRSTDNGKTFSEIIDLPEEIINRGEWDPPDNILVDKFKGDVFLSFESKWWKKQNNNNYFSPIMWKINNDTITMRGLDIYNNNRTSLYTGWIYTSERKNLIMRSSDYGNSWTDITLITKGGSRLINVDYYEPNKMLFTAGKIIFSQDGGKSIYDSWRAKKIDWCPDSSSLIYEKFGFKFNHCYNYNEFGCIFRSVDGKKSWSNISINWNKIKIPSDYNYKYDKRRFYKNSYSKSKRYKCYRCT